MCQVFPRPNPLRTLAHHEAPSKCKRHRTRHDETRIKLFFSLFSSLFCPSVFYRFASILYLLYQAEPASVTLLSINITEKTAVKVNINSPTDIDLLYLTNSGVPPADSSVLLKVDTKEPGNGSRFRPKTIYEHCHHTRVQSMDLLHA